MSDKQILTSPKGTILFSRLRTAGKNSFTGNLEYSMRLEIDGNAPGSKEFKAALKKINKDLVVTDEDKVSKEGNYIINARAKDQPKVFDKDNTTLESDLIPMLENGSTARVQVVSFDGKKGGGINLVGVQLLDINEFVGSAPVDEDELRAALKANHS